MDKAADSAPFQLRIFLKEEFARAAARHEQAEGLKPLQDVLKKHGASLDHNQFDEFSEFVENIKAHPSALAHEQTRKLLELTEKALANPEKVSYFKREFTVSLNGRERLSGNEADALMADLAALEGKVLTAGKAFNGAGQPVPAVRKSYYPKNNRHPGT